MGRETSEPRLYLNRQEKQVQYQLQYSVFATD